MKNFEPVIIGFICNECVYAAADLAGTTRQSYPSNVRLIRVPCSGQVDTTYILRAFINGADGVFVGGCLKEQCHYVDGNIKAEKRMEHLSEILSSMGFDKKRLQIQFMSASMGTEFSHFATEFTEEIKELGPSPLRKRSRSKEGFDNKRDMLRSMLLSISDQLKSSNEKYKTQIPGFGEVEIDDKKCIACGACGYVCKDGAVSVDMESGVVQIRNTYWRCTACGRCRDACPKECIKVREEFDLERFLRGKEEVLVEAGTIACAHCGNSFLPIMLAHEIEKMLEDKSRSTDFVGLCPNCRKFKSAEKIKNALGPTIDINENWKLRKGVEAQGRLNK